MSTLSGVAPGASRAELELARDAIDLIPADEARHLATLANGARRQAAVDAVGRVTLDVRRDELDDRVAHADLLPVLEARLAHAVAVDEGAVRALAIAQHPVTPLAADLGVLARDGVDGQDQIAARAGADRVGRRGAQRPDGGKTSERFGVEQHEPRARPRAERPRTAELLHCIGGVFSHGNLLDPGVGGRGGRAMCLAGVRPASLRRQRRALRVRLPPPCPILH
jgi:hypothetical protein